MMETIKLAKQHAVQIGAHPSYNDRENFGRLPVSLTSEQIKHLICYQVGALQSLAKLQQVSVEYVKPHGALYNQIEQDADSRPSPNRIIVHLGDYIDRGPDAKQVIERFCTRPKSGFHNIWLLGNHEHDMLQFLEGEPTATRWLSNGGRQTLKSYNIPLVDAYASEQEHGRLRGALLSGLPSAHRLFFDNLELIYENGDYLFVHAGLHPNWPISEQSVFDMLWIRKPFLESTRDFGKIVIHGHTPRRRPDVQINRIGIDTGAYHSGCLTCLVLEGNKYRFLHT